MASPSTSLPSNGGGGAFRTDKKALLAALAEELKREKLRAEQAAQRMVEVESQVARSLPPMSPAPAPRSSKALACLRFFLPPLPDALELQLPLSSFLPSHQAASPPLALITFTSLRSPSSSPDMTNPSRHPGSLPRPRAAHTLQNGLAAARAGAVPKGERLANQPHDQTISDAADHHQHFMTKDDVDKVCDRYLQEDPSLKEWEKEVAQRHLWQRERRAQDLEDEQHHFNLMMQDLMTQAEDGDSSNSAPSQRMNALGKHRALSHGELYGSGRRAAIYGRLPTTTAAAFQRW
ncbi:hypothetical protein JCM10213_001042 [Rhodosporidiobolus nylandii]